MEQKKNDKFSDRAAAQARETMDTMSGMLDNATHCADVTAEKVKNRVKEGTLKATNRVEEAVTAAADRIREKVHK